MKERKMPFYETPPRSVCFNFIYAKLTDTNFNQQT